jgi:hypothetical protein
MNDAYQAGRKYAEEYSASQAGMAPEPARPFYAESAQHWRDFWMGVEAYRDEQARGDMMADRASRPVEAPCSEEV